MIRDSWNKVILICGNHGEDHTHVMQLKQGPHSLFYSCPEYKSIYGTDHDGRSCNNRLTLVDFEKMLDYLIEQTYLSGDLNGTDLRGLVWEKNGVRYEVLNQEHDVYTVLMKNQKAISK